MLSLILIVIAYAIIGYGSGILAGIFGIGGGIITVPCLLFIFHLLGIPQAWVVQTAIGTSLAAMLFNTTSAAWAQHARFAVRWMLIRTILPGILIGSILGGIAGHMLSGVILEVIFGIFAVLLGIRFIRRVKVPVSHGGSPTRLGWNGIAAVIGFLSNLLGIGGGAISVPVLTYYRYPTQVAAGTSSAMTLITTFVGALSYFIIGLRHVVYPGNLGYLNLLAFLVVGVFSFFGAPKGVALGHRIKKEVFYRYFGWTLLTTGIFMIFI